ncbi:MAG TPA: hypothetical protein PL048_02590 [Leptospiraceae bacterium]|nr:hypothetical protein [Leptospiraceae bacterium]HMZ57634.1 hypothetical protein [Leptospiraceae bacterium]HNF12349.1 hypothetical protein [Leptospiraceae bacterium]HNF22898.1 hypothetical protein [Leptospiraceae bacterium]HNH07393.1 hypothetical protein [Leptospiraceae bacterium]
MLINKIKSLGQSLEAKKASAVKSTASFISNDNIAISEAAKKKSVEMQFQADVDSITQKALIVRTDELRANKIKDVKSKLLSGYYDNPSNDILKRTADSLLDSFLSLN